MLDKIITHSERYKDCLQGESIKIDPRKKNGLTRQELCELEAREKTDAQRFVEKVILFFPNVCGIAVVLEYMLIPNNSMNRNPYTYLGFLILMIIFYNGYGLHCFYYLQVMIT